MVMNINENMSRRGFVGTVVGGLASIALAGCSGDKSGIELTINSAVLSHSSQSPNEPVLVLNLTACNVSRESQYIIWSLAEIKAYQDGKSLDDEIHVNGFDYSDNNDCELKPGATVDGWRAFDLLDDTTDVEVETTDGSLTNPQTFNLSSLETKEDTDSGNTSGIELTINDAHISDGTDSDDKTKLVLNLSACNVSKAPQYFSVLILLGVKAYQGGKSLESSFINEDDYYTGGDIKPGTTVEGCIAFTLLDDTTDVEVETTDGSLTNPQTFNLSSLETVGK